MEPAIGVRIPAPQQKGNMKNLLLICLLLMACSKPTTTETLPFDIPDWVPDGVAVQITPEGKVVMTADLARALLKDAETRQREYFLHGIAEAARMGRHEYEDEFEGEARVKLLAEDLKSRGFGVTIKPAKNDWFILGVTW